MAPISVVVVAASRGALARSFAVGNPVAVGLPEPPESSVASGEQKCRRKWNGKARLRGWVAEWVGCGEGTLYKFFEIRLCGFGRTKILPCIAKNEVTPSRMKSKVATMYLPSYHAVIESPCAWHGMACPIENYRGAALEERSQLKRTRAGPIRNRWDRSRSVGSAMK